MHPVLGEGFPGRITPELSIGLRGRNLVPGLAQKSFQQYQSVLAWADGAQFRRQVKHAVEGRGGSHEQSMPVSPYVRQRGTCSWIKFHAG